MQIDQLFTNEAQIKKVLVQQLLILVDRRTCQIAFACVSSHELQSQTLLQKWIKWSYASIAKFIVTWKVNVDPAGVAATEARLFGMGNTLPD